MSDEAAEVKASAPRKRYIVTIAFYMPNAGPIPVMAESEEHARELVPKMVPHLKDVQIVDVYEDHLDDEPHEDTPPTLPTLN